MVIETRDFGFVEIPEEEIITFKKGIYGFEDEKRFVLLGKVDDENPFKWLQAVDNKDLCFVVIDPFVFRKDYSPVIDESIINLIETQKEEDIRFLSIVVIPEDHAKMSANLRSPIIINAKKNLAMQYILEQDEYTTRHYILDEMQKGA